MKTCPYCQSRATATSATCEYYLCTNVDCHAVFETDDLSVPVDMKEVIFNAFGAIAVIAFLILSFFFCIAKLTQWGLI